MARLTDALRRAATQSDQEQTSTAEWILDRSTAVERYAGEPFPIELTEHRRVRSSTHSGSQPPVAGESADRPVPTGAPIDLPLPATPHASGVAAAAVKLDVARRSDAEVVDTAAASLLHRIDKKFDGKIVADSRMSATSREQYRKLAAALHHAQNAKGLKVVMIASAATGEGKTLTAANLGLTFSESYRRKVLVIDADLRRPNLHAVFGIDGSPGLSEGLAQHGDGVRVTNLSSRLAILPAGQPSADPMAGLTSDRMRRVLDEARESFDWIIIDTPPITLLPDANLLAAMVDGTVMVVRASVTPFSLVNRALEAVGRSHVIGVVLNQSTEPTEASGYYDQYYTTSDRGIQ